MTLAKSEQDFLSIISLGIGHSVHILPNGVEWSTIKALAEEHGLMGVLIDGIERLPESVRPPKDLLLEWIGEVLQGYEYRYDSYRKAIAGLAGFYNSHDIKMMVLKGYACSIDWPRPEHRPCGDIDIWLFGKQKEADDLLRKEKDLKIDKSHHHHTVFQWGDFIVENHYDFINVHHHKSNVEYEKILKELGQDDSHVINVSREKVYLPSPDLQALFLLKHLMLHFASEGISIRQLLDWAFFVCKHGKEVDWKMIESELEKYGMKEMYGILNAICVEELGFGASVFSFVQFNPLTKEKVQKDIMQTRISEINPSCVLNRAFFRYRRWRNNGWKHELCYKETMWSAFWSGVWNHLLKPSSI